MKKRFALFAVAFLLPTAVATGIAPPAHAACGGGGYSGGNGDAATPYQISTAADLSRLRSTTGDYGCAFELQNDIDMSGEATWSTGIGYSATGFTGSFDGAGYVVSGVSVSSSQQYTGFFGRVYGGSIQDLGVIGSVTSRSTYASGAYIGGLVGSLERATGSGEVSGSFFQGSVAGASGSFTAYAGGLVGSAGTGATMTNSYASGQVEVNSTGANIGGLVGRNNGTVTHAYATTAVVGVGGSTTGGLVASGSGSVIDSFWDTQTTGQASSPGGGTGKTSSEMKSEATFSAWTISSSFASATVWGICEGTSYPYLKPLTDSDPCVSGGGTTSTSGQPSYTFTFLTSDGGRCLPDVTVRRFEQFALPPLSVACTPLGTAMAGWSIPGQDWAFAPGRVVTAVDSQVFTAVAREPRIAIIYDSNVGMATECLAAGVNVEAVNDGRQQTQSVPREDSALLATEAPCTPVGYQLVGWTDQPTLDGSDQATTGAFSYTPGEDVPATWNAGTNPVNAIHLYALWSRMP